MIRVIIADDSAFMRMVLSDLFKKQPDFEVLDTAKNGKEAVEKVLRLKPDLLTMDVNMPVMDGLQALEIIMKDCPIPVVMCSSLTKEGANATIKALDLGAVDFISKAGGSVSKISTIEDEILSKCRAAASARLRRPGAAPVASPPPARAAEPILRRIEMPKRSTMQLPHRETRPLQPRPMASQRTAGSGTATPSAGRPPSGVSPREKLVVLGTSTGGPKALQTVVTGLPKNLPCGVLIVQHMPPGFTKSLAERLDEISQISVKEAENHDIIEAGHVYVAPGNYHMTVVNGAKGKEIVLNQDPPLGTLRPAADVLFKSAAFLGHKLVSVILTGMGSDGAVGMKEIKKHGGYIIAESEATAVVYGMPKAVVEQGIADEILPLPEVAGAIVNAVNH